MIVSRDNQRGYLMVSVVVALFLIAAVAVLISHDSAINANTSAVELDSDRVEYAAQAGMQHALWRTMNNSCMGNFSVTSAALGVSSYTATTTGAGSATQYSFSVDQDAWIRSDDVSKNNGTTADQHIKFENGNQEQALVRFDLSSLPAGAQINSAVGFFYVTTAGPGGGAHPEGPVTVHRLTADWTETGATWETMNGNFDSTVVATIPSQPADGVWVSINLTAQVQAWANGQPNYGMLMASAAEGVHGKYSSREDGGSAPRLEVVVGNGAASPVSIQATGTLVNGVTRTLSRPVTMVYQPPLVQTFSPGPSESEDAEIWDQSPTNNYGDSSETWVSSASNDTTRSLLRFDVAWLPVGVKILDATLSLRRQSGSGADQPVSAHRITNAWTESSVSWNRRESFTDWDTAGGDFDSEAVATTLVGPANQRYEWDLTTLVQGWADGSSENYGVALVAAIAGLPGERFYTSDATQIDRRPSLTVTYACECGNACMSPQGSGNLLMVVSNYLNPSAVDMYKRDLFESWGYSVGLMDDDTPSIFFDTIVATGDVVYISETAKSSSLGNKLSATSKGVVSEEGMQNVELGIASGYASPVGHQINITDTDHYITRIFPAGNLPIFSRPMEGLTVSGSEAAGLQTLADWGGAGTLVALPAGADMEGGGAAPGRRAMLPIGRDTSNFGWRFLNNSGQLIVQRTIAWALGADVGSSGRLLMVVGNDANLTTQDDAKKGLLESWGYKVTVIDEDDSQGEFNTALASADVVFVPEDVNASDVNTKLADATIGVVSEEMNLADDFGIADDIEWESGTTLDIDTNAHYITAEFNVGPVVLFSSSESVARLDEGLAPGLSHLASLASQPMLVALNAGAITNSGGTAAGRRVLLPWGGSNMDVNSLTAEGLSIFRRALEWGVGANLDLQPIAHWKFDETAGTTAIDSEGGHNGTLTNGPGWASGQLDGGLVFDGVDDAVIVSHNSALALTQAMTFTAWIKSNEFGASGSYDLVISKGNVATEYDYYFGTLDDEIVFGFSAGGTYREFTTSALDLPTGTWHHISATFDNSTDIVKLYHGGVEVLSAMTTYDPPTNSRDLYIGSSEDGADWDGVLDDVRIYDRALTPSEIAELAEPPPLLPIAHWKLDDGTGATAIDSIGGHDGTLINGPAWAAGKLSGALDFDGTNDFVDVPHDDSLSLTETMTFMAWINASSFGTSYQTIIAKDASGSGSNFFFGTWRQELVFGFYSAGSFREVFTSGLNLQPGTWYHLAASFDNASGQVLLYLDGAQVRDGTLSFSPTVVSAGPRIGRSPDGERWRGLLDDVRIYGRVLSAADIATLADANAGPIAHWKLDETSGSTAVDSIEGHDGTLVNGPSWAAGKIDGGLSFDGNDDYIEIASMNPMSYDDFTVSAWYKSADTGVSDDEYIFEHNENFTNEITFGPTDDGTDDRLRFGFANGGSGTWDPHYGTSDIVDQQWHLVVGVRSAGRIKIYVDGILETDGADAHAGATITIDGDGPFIGDLPGNTERVHGSLDDVRLYDRALSDTEVSDLYSAGGASFAGGGSCSGTFRDEFNARNYSGGDGSLAWAGDWEETGETTNPTGGDIRVDDDINNYQLQVRDDGQTVWREADLSTATSATLNFDYRRQNLSGSNDYVAVEVSYDGGSNWSELDRFTGTATDGSYSSASYPLNAGSLSAITRIRFRTPNSGMSNNNMVWFDNVEISCSP